MTRSRPNDFQTVTEAQLRQRLESIGVELRNVNIEGITMAYIVGEIEDVRIWIYPDQADICGRGVDWVLEPWDYASLEELREDFIEKVLDLFKKS